MFLKNQLLATLHSKIKPSRPKICLKMPSGTPQEGPRRAQDSPRWAQDGPKKGRRATTQAPKIIPGARLGPSWGHLGLNVGLFTPNLQATSHPSCSLLALETPIRPASNHSANCLKLRYCQSFDGNADRNDKDSKEPKHQPTSLRSRSGGMRGAIKSAATVYGEHGRAKQLVRILDRFLPVPDRN